MILQKICYTNASLNNSFVAMSTELMGRVNLGEGVLDNMVYEATKNLILSPIFIPDDIPLIDREILPLKDELKMPDRQEFENKLFKSIGLIEREIILLQESLLELVENRQKKAESR